MSIALDAHCSGSLLWERRPNLLERDGTFRRVLDANPKCDVWLLDAMWAPSAGRGRRVWTHHTGPVGVAIAHTSDEMVRAAQGSAALPYTIDSRLLRDMEASLRDAPWDMQAVASVSGWNVTAVLMQPDPVTGRSANPIVTCNPN